MSFVATLGAGLALPSLNTPALAQTATPVAVTTTADVTGDDGVISLREAITYSNTHPGTTIGFNIPLSQAVDGVFTIKPTSALPWITADGIVIDGATQTAATGNTNAAGPEIELDGTNAGGTPRVNQVSGLMVVNASNFAVRNIAINSFSGRGLRLLGAETSGAVVTGCYIGTDAAGTAAKPNGDNGVALHQGASGTRIGDGTVAGRNVIAGNSSSNIALNNEGTDNNLIQGNYIGTNAAGTARLGNTLGIHIADGPSNNTIGGTSEGLGNVITGAGSNIQIQGVGTTGNTVQGNFIGTDKTGMTPLHAAGHSILITHSSENTTLGGTTPGARNIISDATTGSVGVTFSDNNTIQGNYIGVNAAGTGVFGASGFGVVLYASSNNTVGGSGAGAGNVITGNNRIGVWIFSEEGQDNSDNNRVQGNLIGTDPSGTSALGNQTIGVEFNSRANGNVIGLDRDGAGAGNTIAFNTTTPGTRQAGVMLVDGLNVPPVGNTIRGNSIHSSGSLGINIRLPGEALNTVTPNDAGDGDTGPNHGQNYPVLASAVAGSSTTVRGTLNSTPGRDFILDFYSNDEADPSGHGEGQNHIGSTEVHTDAAGNASFTFKANDALLGKFITATATDATTGSTGEFSAAAEVVAALSISGRIATSDGTGIDNVTVGIGSVSAPVVTNSNGEYAFTDLPAGTYTVTPTRSGYLFTASEFTNPVTVGPDRTNINFIGKAPVAGSYTIRGRLANHSGAGVAGVSIALSNGRQVSTDSNGDYVFTGVGPGSYTVAPQFTPSLNGVTFSPASYDVIVNSSSLNNISFTASYSVTGRVANHLGAGIPNVQVKRTAGSSVVSVFTDANGNYRFEGVRSGSYTVEPVLTPAMSGLSFTPVSKLVTVDRSNIFNQSFIGMFSISGRIANHSGVGIPNVQVQRVVGSSVVSTFTDSSGNYRFTNVRAGSYTLAPVLTPAMSGMSFTPASTSVTVGSTSLTNQNFIGMFSISGRITSSAGTPQANVLVRLNAAGGSSTSTQTDSDGNYRFNNVRSDSYTIVPEGGTFTPQTRSLTISTMGATNQNFIG